MQPIVGMHEAGADIREGLLSDHHYFDREIETTPYIYGSEVCRVEHFLRNNYFYWCQALREGPRFHRKQWEFVYICAALAERGLLKPNHRGIGFGVGTEPLAECFASLGISVTATDLRNDFVKGATLSILGSRYPIPHRGGIASDLFDNFIKLDRVDMRAVGPEHAGYDFSWSACVIEHMASIDDVVAAVRNAVAVLRPGGVSVHTTEINLGPDDGVIVRDDKLLFRARDFRRIAAELRQDGHHVAPLSFYPGSHPIDVTCDAPPFREDPHMRLDVNGYPVTSFGFVVTRA